MKIDSGNPISTRSLRSAGNSGRATPGGFSSLLSGTDAKPAASGAAPASRVNILAALEEVDSQERRKRAVRRGDRMLDLLDELRMGMLSGSVPSGVISDLAGSVREARDGVDDPELLAILDEIDLRAQVELAKHGQALGNR